MGKRKDRIARNRENNRINETAEKKNSSKKIEFYILSDGKGQRILCCDFDLGVVGSENKDKLDNPEFEAVFRGEALNRDEMLLIIDTEYYEKWIEPIPIKLHGKRIQTMADMLDAMIPYYRMDIKERKRNVEFYEWVNEEDTLAKILPAMVFDEAAKKNNKGNKQPGLLLNAEERDMLAKDLVSGDYENCDCDKIWNKIEKAV